MLRVFLGELRVYFCNKIINKVPSHTLRLLFYKKVMKFSVGKHSAIFLNCTFECAKGIKIGDNSVINTRCHLDSRGGIIIGSNVAIASDVIILTADHDLSTVEFVGRSKQVLINDFVWIGTRATILPGINLGEGAVVGAGSVVTKNVDPYTFVAGVPAKFIKDRPRNLNYNTSYRRRLR